jgi:hypothetical protein
MFMGIDMSIFCPGDGEACGVGVGEPVGICIPGMLSMLSVAFCCDAGAVGIEEAEGICIPGMFPIPGFSPDGEGVGVGECDGICIPFMFMPCMSRFGAGRGLLLRLAAVLVFELVFRFVFALAFGLPMSIPGMFCMFP